MLSVLIVLSCFFFFFLFFFFKQKTAYEMCGRDWSSDVCSSDLVDIPAEKVDQFVSAYLSVTQLIEERGQDLQRAETEAESLQLERTVETDAIDLIKASGLTQQDYFQLLGLANTDPEFRDRVLAQLEERDR